MFKKIKIINIIYYILFICLIIFFIDIISKERGRKEEIKVEFSNYIVDEKQEEIKVKIPNYKINEEENVEIQVPKKRKKEKDNREFLHTISYLLIIFNLMLISNKNYY